MDKSDFHLRHMDRKRGHKKSSKLKASLLTLVHTTERGIVLLWQSHRLVLFTLLIALLFAAIVPYDGDEFYQYQPLFCRYYLHNALNTFRAGCSEYDLNFLNTGLILPLRAYWYSGSFPSLYYLPLFLLWPSPISARWLNILFLLLEAVTLSKLTQIKLSRVFIGLLLFFPYLFQHVVDTGPVSFQLLSVYLLAFLFQRWMEKLRWQEPVLIGILVFLAIWTKLIYVALLPGIALIFIVTAWEARLTREQLTKRCLPQLAAGLLTGGVLMACLAFSTSPSNPEVYPIIAQFTQRGEARTLAELKMQFWDLGVVQTLLNPLAATHRIYRVWPITQNILTALYDVLLYLSVPLLIAVAAILKPSRAKQLLLPAISYVAFMLTLFLLVRMKSTWAMHHTVLSFPFLILSILMLLRLGREKKAASAHRLASRILLAILGILAAMNLLWFALFSAQQTNSVDDPSKKTVNALLQEPEAAAQYFYVITDWSMYFFQGLYGNSAQSVLYIRPLNQQAQIDALKQLSQEHGRKLLFVVQTEQPDSDLSLINASFTLRRCEALEEQSVWQILYEQSSELEKICSR